MILRMPARWLLLCLLVLACPGAAATIPRPPAQPTPLRQVFAAVLDSASLEAPAKVGSSDCLAIEHTLAGFYCLGARHYDPQSGRFLSPDPLGHAASLSLYDYADGDPVNGIDPDGRLAKGVSSGWNGSVSANSPDSRAFNAGLMLGGYFGGAAEGLRGGSSIAANNLTLGYSNSRGWTDSMQYQGGAYTASRYLSGAGTAGLYAAGVVASGGALLEASPTLYVAAANVASNPLAMTLGTGAAVGGLNAYDQGGGLGDVVVGSVLGAGMNWMANPIIPRGGPIQVTQESIAGALKSSPMQTAQGAVSLPAVERYVRLLEAGKVAPPITVDGKTIVDGNHRYVAGRLFGLEPDTVPGALAPSQVPKVKPITQIVIDPADWGNR